VKENVPLNGHQVETLCKAIKSYNYPAKLYNFEQKCEIQFTSMRKLESYLKEKLLSTNPVEVKWGLANIIYWGYLNAGYCMSRVQEFLDKIKQKHIQDAITLFSKIKGDGLMEIKKINLPQFSNMSFVSKLRMFLDPENYVVLDRQLLKIKGSKIKTIFHNVKGWTYIPITNPNCEIYRSWCELCRKTAKTYFKDKNVRAVDVERGIFHLVCQNCIETAAELIANMSDETV
jgi:hypothetical protein